MIPRIRRSRSLPQRRLIRCLATFLPLVSVIQTCKAFSSTSTTVATNEATKTSPLWLPPSSHLEFFSVAPMMAHTNRHYRFFFRQLSQYAHIYTEMMPSSQIVQVFELAAKACGSQDIPYEDPELMQELSHRIFQHQQNHPSVLYSQENAGYFAERNLQHFNILQEIMAPMNGYHSDPIVLQLGGRNPELLGKATAIAMAFGFTQINLNCGCPSSSVATGNQAGAALMLEPELVAECLESMSKAMAYYQSGDNTVALSLKHRLGVAFANEYDAAWDHQQTDEAAYQSCHDFLKVMASTNSMLSKVQVHARLALLGMGDVNSNSYTEGDVESESPQEDDEDAPRKKVNHKRVQYFAKRQARQATIQNRSVPPLRPKVVEQIAQDFGNQWQIVSNGGIQSMSDIADRLQRQSAAPGNDETSNLWQGQAVTGAMVGRAAINHPCAFATVDSVLWGADKSDKEHIPKTRKQVLETYMEYCQVQEDLVKTTFPSTSPGQWQIIRKHLVAVPFHLFMGEDGNNAYQRRLRKLTGRGERTTAKGMLDAAAKEVPSATLTKSVEEHTPWTNIEKFEFTKRSGSMQRTIY